MTTIADISKDTVSNTSKTAGEPTWLIAARETAWEKYSTTPYPTVKEELWKYTPLTSMDWNIFSLGTPEEVVVTPISADARKNGVIFCSLRDALKTHPDLVKKYLGRSKEVVNGKFAVENLALTDRGLFCFVPRGVKVTVPIHGEYRSTQDGATLFPRTVVVLEDNAEAIFFENFTSPGLVLNQPHSGVEGGTHTALPGGGATRAPIIAYCNARVELYVGQNARLHYLQLQNWHMGMTHLLEQHAELAQDAYVSATTITLGGRIAKSTIGAILNAPGATSFLFGLGYANTDQQFDHHTMQMHRAPNTTSDLLYKMAVDDEAKSTYTGKITMTPAAQKADAYQSNKNLLLSKTARANTVPQLEILANDVRCTHGASVGTVEEDQLYYLESRGLSRDVARDMIVHGFFEDLIGKLPEESLKTAVRKAINAKLGTENEVI